MNNINKVNNIYKKKKERHTERERKPRESSTGEGETIKQKIKKTDRQSNRQTYTQTLW